MTHYLAADIQNNTLMRTSALSVLQSYNVREPPVNVYQILKDQEVQVDFWSFSNSKLDGLYLRNITGSGIAINRNHPHPKKRFTAAHELKHHLHDVPDDRAQLPPCLSNARTHIERKANAFAAEILMPPGMFQAVITDLAEELLTITTLAAVFRVSYEATVYRLNSLGYITDGQKTKFLLQNFRRDDGQATNQNKQNGKGKLAKIRLPAVLAALGHVDEERYCVNCNALLINSQWNICPDCNADLKIITQISL